MRPPRRAARAAALLLAGTLAAAASAHDGHKAGPPAPAADLPVLVLPGGASFRLLQIGPVTSGGRPVGLGLAHLSAAATPEVAAAEAEALWAYLRPRAEGQGQEAAAVLAHLGAAGAAPGPAFPVVWRRLPTGEWRRDPLAATPFPVPASPPPPMAPRDAQAEARARASGAAWLALADEGRWAEAFDAASPILGQGGSRRRFAALGRLWDEQEGRIAARTPAAMLLARSLPGLPPGSYLVLESQCRMAGREGTGFEALTLVRADDGDWRAAAYSRRGPRDPATP